MLLHHLYHDFVGDCKIETEKRKSLNVMDFFFVFFLIKLKVDYESHIEVLQLKTQLKNLS